MNHHRLSERRFDNDDVCNHDLQQQDQQQQQQQYVSSSVSIELLSDTANELGQKLLFQHDHHHHHDHDHPNQTTAAVIITTKKLFLDFTHVQVQDVLEDFVHLLSFVKTSQTLESVVVFGVMMSATTATTTTTMMTMLPVVTRAFLTAISENRSITKLAFENSQVLANVLADCILGRPPNNNNNNNDNNSNDNDNNDDNNCSTLQCLELEYCNIIADNEDDGLEQVWHAFRCNTSLTSLVIHAMEQRTLERILLSLAERNPKTSSLQHLDISSSFLMDSIQEDTSQIPLTNAIGTVLQKCHQLQHLELWKFQFHQECNPFTPIAQGIVQAATALTKLSLEDVHFDSDSTQLFEQMFQQHTTTTLQSLHLEPNVRFSKPTAKVLTTILQYCKNNKNHNNVRLREIHADSMGRLLPKECSGFEELLLLLHDHTHLTSLSLGFIGYSKDDFMIHDLLTHIPKFQYLKQLAFIYDHEHDKHVWNILKPKLLHALKCNSSFEHVDADFPLLTPNEEYQIHSFCQRNQHLPRLLLILGMESSLQLQLQTTTTTTTSSSSSSTSTSLLAAAAPRLFQKALECPEIGPTRVFQGLLNGIGS